MGETASIERDTFHIAASEALPLMRRRGEALRRVGWVGGVYPSAPLPARTAASDGHTAFIRAARSAKIGFAVILLSKAMDVGRDHLIHRYAVPLPLRGEGLNAALMRRDRKCRA